MKKTVLRLYDKNDEYSLQGKCYFVVLESSFDDLSDHEFEVILNCISSMSWQHYTSYAVGEVEIDESELFLCEILNYDYDECHIDASRVENLKKYKLPKYITG